MSGIKRGSKVGGTNRRRRRIKSRMFIEQGGLCYYCLVAMVLEDPGDQQARGRVQSRRLATFEHKVSYVQGGTNQQSNLCLVCLVCNMRKGYSSKVPARGEWDWTQHPEWYEPGGPWPPTPKSHAEVVAPIRVRPIPN